LHEVASNITSANRNTTTLAKTPIAIFAARERPLTGDELMGDTVASGD
jgi:hypothetical protein